VAARIDNPDSLDERQRHEVRELARVVEARDGQPPLSDQALTQLADRHARHLLAHDEDRLSGYAQLDGASLELLADPPSGLDDLLEAVEPDLPPQAQIWSHGRRAPLADVLAARGYVRGRVLHQLRRPLDAVVPEPAPPSGVTIRPFVRGQDEDAWLRVNAAAFATHAEQGSWTRTDLQAREDEPWFEPAGFLLADRAGAVVGFHWTKIHGDGAGEVYVLGIDPSEQGHGLGHVLLQAGLAHLARRGCPLVLLYVDESNTGAMALYRRAGFDSYDVDVQWHRPDTGPA